MASELSKCSKCGKVFAPRPGKTWCAACTAGHIENLELIDHAIEQGHGDTLEDIVAFTGLPRGDVRRILKESSSLHHAVFERGPCTRCKDRPAQAGSDFCWSCRAELYKAFGDAADDLFASLGPLDYVPQFPGHAFGVASALEAKRARAGSSRFNPTPRNKYSG